MPARFQPSFEPGAPGAQKPKRGRLKIFLGYSSGVGKTFRMLDEARRRKERGEDVIVVACQAGAQAEVRTLLDQLETIPTLRTSLGEGLHMDAIVRRHPQVCLVDPLAHNNPRGFQNAKRWQDIEQLLENGISVLTAINLLYIEELRERVEMILGKHTKETVPREFLTRADEIVLVDAPTDLSLKHESGSLAADPHRERKLSELREMALVLAAEVVEVQLEQYLEANGIKPVSSAHERILVCVTPRSDGASMIASGKRNQERFHGELHVVSVSQPHLSSAEKARLQEFFAMAKEAGAETHWLKGDDPVVAILEYAREKKITQVFIGHSARRDWLSRVWAGPLDRLLRGSEKMDIRIFPQ